MSSPTSDPNLTPKPPSHHSSLSTQPSESTSSGSFLTFPMTYAVSGILRRLSSDTHHTKSPGRATRTSSNGSMDGVYAPPKRKASPFQPPPLTPLVLSGWKSSTNEGARLLTRALAEEIRLLVPARVQLVENWDLIYSLEQDGVSLATLYEKCDEYRGRRGGFVLVIRDGVGGVSELPYTCTQIRNDLECSCEQTFGAYLSDVPHPSAHYYGTGECFLWKASILKTVLDISSLPPPPSADTTNAQRQTTLLHPKAANVTPHTSKATSRSGTSTPERLRFKAFPYSGVNDYMIFCEQRYVSIGGG